MLCLLFFNWINNILQWWGDKLAEMRKGKDERDSFFFLIHSLFFINHMLCWWKNILPWLCIVWSSLSILLCLFYVKELFLFSSFDFDCLPNFDYYAFSTSNNNTVIASSRISLCSRKAIWTSFYLHNFCPADVTFNHFVCIILWRQLMWQSIIVERAHAYQNNEWLE